MATARRRGEAGRRLLSVVIPAHDEERTLGPTAGDLARALAAAEIAYEVVIVDEASADETGRVAEELAAADAAIRVIPRGHARGRRQRWLAALDDFFARRIPAEGCVLGLGCGFGEFINAVRARRRIAVDRRTSSRDALGEGVEFFESRGARGPGVGDGEADVVFCSNLLEPLPDGESVTAWHRESHRLLGAWGRLLPGPEAALHGLC